MSSPTLGRAQATRSHRPRPFTVFAAAFVAGAAASVGVNRAIDIHLAQTRPQVEREPIFVALHSLPQGSPVTVWDVALRDWPKAMLPATAMRATDCFDGLVLKHPLREGQPILSAQLVRAQAAAVVTAGSNGPETLVSSSVVPVAVAAGGAAPAAITPPHARSADARPARSEPPAPIAPAPQADLWLPGEQAVAPLAPEPPLASLIPPRPTTTQANTQTAPHAAATDIANTTSSTATNGTATTSTSSTATTDIDIAAAIDGLTTGRGVDAAKPADVGVQRQTVAAAPVAPAPGEAIMHYLVMPERIAAQAERSFAAPAAAGRTPTAAKPPVQKPVVDVPRQPSARATPAPARTSSSRQAAGRQPVLQPTVSRQPAARTADQNGTSNQQPANIQPTAAKRTTPAKLQPRPAAPPRAPAAGQTASSPKTSSLKTMFPNISAGIGAVETQLRKIGIGPSVAAAKDDAADPQDDATKVAQKPVTEQPAARRY